MVQRALGVLSLCALSALASGCPDEEPTEEPDKEPPVILFNNAQDPMDMGEEPNTKTPTDMSANMMTPMECSVGERCGEECVDTNTDQANCGTCGNACSDGAACQDGSCFEQTADCRQEPCKGFFYCNLADGTCLEGCDKDEQCSDNATCDVFGHECVCEEGFHGCAGQCVNSASPQHCGDSCEPCPTPQNGAATCNGDGTCGIVCDAGFHLCGDRCVSDDSVDHCGDRCEPCPTDANGAAICTSGGECALQCDSGFRDCEGACASCPGDATNTACSGSACVASSCPGGTLLCSGQCATCPSDPGATQLTCDVRDECVIQSCQSGLELCGDGCKQCPTQNVLSASCNASGECAIEACPAGRHPCGDSCCQWSTSPTLITRSKGAVNVSLVRDANGLSLSFVNDGLINSFSHSEHWSFAAGSGTWSKAHQYEFDNLQGEYSNAFFAFREGSQNYALFLEDRTYHLAKPSGQDNWTVLGSVQRADEDSALALRGDDGSVYVVAENPQNFRPEMYRVSPTSGTKFNDLNLNFPQLHDLVYVNKEGKVFLTFDDTFGAGLLVYKQSGNNFAASTAQACNELYSYSGDFGFAVDALGRATILRVECRGAESDGLWASTEVALGQWTQTLVTPIFDGSGSDFTSDKLGNLVIAPDGVLHTCFLHIENSNTDQIAVYYGWRAAEPTAPWKIEKVHTGTDIRECAINTTADSVPHIIWRRRDDSNSTTPWEYQHLAPN